MVAGHLLLLCLPRGGGSGGRAGRHRCLPALPRRLLRGDGRRAVRVGVHAGPHGGPRQRHCCDGADRGGHREVPSSLGSACCGSGSDAARRCMRWLRRLPCRCPWRGGSCVGSSARPGGAVRARPGRSLPSWRSRCSWAAPRLPCRSSRVAAADAAHRAGSGDRASVRGPVGGPHRLPEHRAGRAPAASPWCHSRTRAGEGRSADSRASACTQRAPHPVSRVLLRHRPSTRRTSSPPRAPRSRSLTGTPSRARLSAEGDLAATTSFVSGDSYAADGFSTRTVITPSAPDPLRAGKGIDLESFRLVHRGKAIRPADRNYWGVTFAGDHDRFFVTVAFGGDTWLAQGSLTSRTTHPLRADAECLHSPRMAAGRLQAPEPHPRRLAARGPRARQRGRDLLAEDRSVDDQVEWLDNTPSCTPCRAPVRRGALGSDVWRLPADGSGAPRSSSRTRPRPPCSDDDRAGSARLDQAG